MIRAFPVLYCCALPEQPLHVTVVPPRRARRASCLWAGRGTLPFQSREENLQTKGWSLLKSRGISSPGLKRRRTCWAFAFSFACAKRFYVSFLLKGVKREWSLARDTKIPRELCALCRLCASCDKSRHLLMLRFCSTNTVPCLTALLWGLKLEIRGAQREL